MCDEYLTDIYTVNKTTKKTVVECKSKKKTRKKQQSVLSTTSKQATIKCFKNRSD